ncbi:ABC transporter ATP-binding protein [Gleimia coleocanis]|nr:ABC transporter ATP-binding protein [Gleimia coleocanis]
MSDLVLRDVSVFYGFFQAVKSVDLRVPAGQIVALLGGSGSGKSSLLRAIAGLEAAVGELRFGDVDLQQVPVHRRGFGLMFQDGQLFGHRSVAGNIQFGIRQLPRAERNLRTSQLLELVGLPGFEKRRISSLSGGQQQRVALARALAPHPQLLLLDEPLSALDRGLREQLAVEIRRVVKAAGLSAIYVTHDQEEALAVADRVLVMQDGVILRDATGVQIWRDPQFKEVAQFLGFPLILPLAVAGEWGFVVPEGGADSDSANGRFFACAPHAFKLLRVFSAECNTRILFDVAERNSLNPRFVAEVLGWRIGRAQVEVSLRGPGGWEFSVAAPLGVLAELEAHVGVLRSGAESGVGVLRSEVEVALESVCLVTEAGPN